MKEKCRRSPANPAKTSCTFFAGDFFAGVAGGVATMAGREIISNSIGRYMPTIRANHCGSQGVKGLKFPNPGDPELLYKLLQ